jgi:hypothetical protein
MAKHPGRTPKQKPLARDEQSVLVQLAKCVLCGALLGLTCFYFFRTVLERNEREMVPRTILAAHRSSLLLVDLPLGIRGHCLPKSFTEAAKDGHSSRKHVPVLLAVSGDESRQQEGFLFPALLDRDLGTGGMLLPKDIVSGESAADNLGQAIRPGLFAQPFQSLIH